MGFDLFLCRIVIKYYYKNDMIPETGQCWNMILRGLW